MDFPIGDDMCFEIIGIYRNVSEMADGMMGSCEAPLFKNVLLGHLVGPLWGPKFHSKLPRGESQPEAESQGRSSVLVGDYSGSHGS